MEIKRGSKAAAYRENVISTSGQLFTRMREPCNGATPGKATTGSSGLETPLETPPLMAIKLPRKPCAVRPPIRWFAGSAGSPVRLSARCHIRSFPLYRELRGCNFTEGVSFALPALSSRLRAHTYARARVHTSPPSSRTPGPEPL